MKGWTLKQYSGVSAFLGVLQFWKQPFYRIPGNSSKCYCFLFQMVVYSPNSFQSITVNLTISRKLYVVSFGLNIKYWNMFRFESCLGLDILNSLGLNIEYWNMLYLPNWFYFVSIADLKQ